MFWLVTFLALSTVAVLAGAGIAVASRQRPTILRVLRGLSAGAIGALVFVHLLPEAFDTLGGTGLLLFGAGLFSTALIEWIGGHDEHAERVGPSLGVAEIVLLGLIVHAVLDGLGLSTAARAGRLDSPMAWAIIAHQLPVSAVLCWAFLRRVSARAAVIRLTLLAVATIFGAGLGEVALSVLDDAWVGGLGAFIAGTLLHMLLHDFVAYPAESRTARRTETISFGVGLLAVLPLFGLAHGHEHGELSAAVRFGEAFLDLFVEAAPYVLIGTLFAGILATRLRHRPLLFLGRGSNLSQAVRGTLFGLPLPICSCGILPAVNPLVRAGVPVAAVTSFLLATPELGVDSVLLSWRLLGGPLTIVRVVMAFVFVTAVALIVARWGRGRAVAAQAPAAEEPVAVPKGFVTKVRESLRAGFVDTLDEIGPWLILGVAIGAVVMVVLPPGALSQIMPPPFDVVVFAAIGIPLYVCASGATPMAAVLLYQGASPGAVLAFLLVGPATNVATLGYVSRVWGRRSAVVLGVGALVVATLLGILTNLAIPTEWLVGAQVTLGEEHGLFELVCAGVLGGLLLAGLWRRGPLDWLSVIFELIPIGHRHGPARHHRVTAQTGASGDNGDAHDHHGHDHHDHDGHEHDGHDHGKPEHSHEEPAASVRQSPGHEIDSAACAPTEPLD